MNKTLEGRDLGEPVEQLALVDRIAGWPEALFFDGFQQPGALGGIFDVRHLVAGGAAVDLL